MKKEQQEKRKLLAKVAYLYYIENKTQSEIAELLHIYRTTISRMLKQAREQDIIKIEIEDVDSELLSLELYVKKKYKLRYLEIVPSVETDNTEEKEKKLAQAAAYFLKRNIESNAVVGISWGATVGQAIQEIENKRVTQSLFVPIVGGPSHVNSKYHVNTLVYEMARKFKGKSIFVNAMAVQELESVKTAIVQSRYFEELRMAWEHLDMAIVGIGGNLSYKKSQWRDLLTTADYEELRLREAVGDCCCRFFDQEGKILKGELYKRTIGIELESLAKVPCSLGIARGKNKSKAILSVLRQGSINSLLTDQETIVDILRLDKDITYKSDKRK